MSSFRSKRTYSARVLCLALLAWTSMAQAQWVAFNDHVAGSISQTHSNATTLKIPANNGPTTTNILLKNIANGTDLNVMLTISRSANGVAYNLNGSNPSPGTPLYNTFSGFVYFGAGLDCNVALSNSLGGTVTYTFSGLNPAALYSFKGGAVRGNSVQTTNWTSVQLEGALSFTDAHSARVVTKAQVNSLATNQVAVTFGQNSIASSGDQIDWENIDPGPDGIFSVVCTNYIGATNAAGDLAKGALGYAITGIRLEEVLNGPPLIKVQPTNQNLFSGDTATFSVGAIGISPLSYQWFRNDAPISGATSTNYTTEPLTVLDNDSKFYVVVTNPRGPSTSSIVTLTVSNSAPVITTQPVDQSVTAPATATFSVAAVGSRPLTYQWYRNGSMILGATGLTYTTLPTSINDSGAKFSAQAFNSVGNSASSNATLVVSVPPQMVMPYTNVWRYDQSGRNLSNAWYALEYDDTTWPLGPGFLAREDNLQLAPYINTPLSLDSPSGSRIRTFYFRTHFVVTNVTASFLLVASNYVDDGAVYYLNGREFKRYNMAEPPAPIFYNTLAANSPPTEGPGGFFTNVVPAELVQDGENVLAVEVHQITDSSADIVFGMGLTAFFLAPTELAITNNPEDRTISEGLAASFTVGYTGAPARFQWFKWINGAPVPVPNATKRSYTITNASMADAGYYFVVLSNNVNSVASSAARLTVVPDESGPRLLVADGNTTSTQITLSFSELVAANEATNISNYVLTNVTSGGTLAITSAILQNGSNVVLTTSARVVGQNYLLVVKNVPDLSLRHNVMAPNSAIPIATTLTLVGLNQPGWDFYNPVLGPPWEPYEPPADWKEVGFTVPDFDWGHESAGLFAYNPNQSPVPAPVNTTLSGGAISSYYRFPFQFAASPVGAQFFLRYMIDDGMIAYLNGAEIYRYNMPTGGVNALTPASSSVLAFDSGSIPLLETPVVVGSNVFAGELHGTSDSDPNLVFGAELKAQIFSWANGPVLVTSGPEDVFVSENGSARFSFMGVGIHDLQWQTNGVPVPGANRPTFHLASCPVAWDGMLVRVLASNSTSMAVSTNARLHVIPDTTPPSLVSAFVQSNGVLLTFSEPLLPNSATNLANYRLTNSMGGSFQFTAASLLSPSNVFLIPDGGVPASNYRVAVSGVRDGAIAQNEIAPNTTATLGMRLSIPFDAVWKFNTNGTDLGTAWRAIGFDDSTPDWSSGPGLIADETGALPEPIKTPISRLVNGQYHYTFYFRYHFFLPALVTNEVVVTFRHVIDDGAIMYINGQDFHSFNMANTPANVTYTSESSVNVGDAVYVGPFVRSFTNLVAGDNVIAVEVHQNGSFSADVTFGAEFSADIPSVVFPGEVPAYLQVSREDGNTIISWTGNGFTLEASDVLGAGAHWEPVSGQSNPYFTSPFGSTARFYRLRK